MIAQLVAKAIETFAAAAPVPFNVHVDVTSETALPLIIVRETDTDDLARTSDRSSALYESYVDIFIAADTVNDASAVRKVILANAGRSFDGGIQAWDIQSSQNVTSLNKPERIEYLLELEVVWTEDYS